MMDGQGGWKAEWFGGSILFGWMYGVDELYV